VKGSPALTLNWVLLGIPDDEGEVWEDGERRDTGFERRVQEDGERPKAEPPPHRFPKSTTK
jgi:hypothetical protein